MKELDEIRARLAAKLPDDARMDAYYYGFDRTGVGSIDAILSAVAIAGKGSHHTESWGDEGEFGYYANRPGLPSGKSAVDLIQSAADIAARNHAADLARLLAAVEAVEAACDRVIDNADGHKPPGPPNPSREQIAAMGIRAAITAALTPTTAVPGGAGESRGDSGENTTIPAPQ